MSAPKMPEPAAWKVAASFFTHHDCIPAGLLPPVAEPEPLYTADQVRTIQREAFAWALEVAAKAVEQRTHRKRWVYAAMNSEPIKPCELAAAIMAIRLPELP